MTRHPSARSASRRLRLILAMALVSWAASASVTAQLELESRVSNHLSYRPGGIPTGPGGTASGEPVLTPQFSNFVETNGGSAARSTSANVIERHPSGGSVVIIRSSIGNTFASGVPRYFLGDRIMPPTEFVNADGATVAVAADYWRKEPLRPGEVVLNPGGGALQNERAQAVPNTGGVVLPALPPGVYEPFYYSPHAREVFANQAGQVEIWWRSLLPDSSGNYVLMKEVFSVSSATTRVVNSMYWTEKSFDAPLISFGSGRVSTVNPVFSNMFPASVSQEYSAPGVSPPTDPNAQPVVELRTVWFDKTSGSGTLHAYNITGRLMVEYLGALRLDGTYEFLGADIIEVMQTPPSTTLTVVLGEEIRPAPDDRKLIAMPVESGSAGTSPLYGSSSRPDGSLAYHAEQENLIEDRIVFYWMERKDAAIPPASGLAPGLLIDWPKLHHKYLQVWPQGVDRFAHSIVPGGGSTADNGTGLRFEGGNIPTLVFQDDASQLEATLDTLTQRLLVQPGSDSLNRTLLKFTGDNGGIWYVRLMTQSADSASFVEGDGGAPIATTARVGSRIDPPSGDYSPAGYIASGTDYSPNAYIDPFAGGVAAAEKGAIIPVNAKPAGESRLTVWWFRKINPPSSEFSPIHTAAKSAVYTLGYPSSGDSIVLASNAGSGELTTAQANGSIYFQNNSAAPGYNPNEEHAIMHGGRAYALRDDLNVTSGSSFTSGPFVLLQYTDSSDKRPAMRAFAVKREDEFSKFRYSVTAGTILQPPMPLPVMPLPIDPAGGLSRNLEVPADPMLYPADASSAAAPNLYTKFTFKDRKGYDWIYRGPHKASDPTNLPPSAPLANSEFNAGGNRGYWTTQSSNTGTITVSGGSLNGSAIGNGDANLSTSGLPPFAGSSVPVIEIRLKASGNFTTQLFWSNQDGGFDTTGHSTNVSYTGNGSWQTLVFSLSTSTHWAGKTINALRFDPVTTAGATFQIDWIRASAASPALGMQWYYTMRDGFHIPGQASQPAVGTILPYLRPPDGQGGYLGNPVTGTPLTVTYQPQWPVDTPTLRVGETLTLPKFGLPAVRGQTSAEVLYQQSIADETTAKAAVVLHDPTRMKSVLLNAGGVGLAALPASIATTVHRGKTHFQLLPPHLQDRFYFDPNLGEIGGLVLTGTFVDEIAGDDYLHLNVLSDEDIATLEDLPAPTDPDAIKWSHAIEALSTVVDTFIEDPARRGTFIPDVTRRKVVAGDQIAEITNSETAVDSYALTATGAGSGYSTLIFGNGRAFTPAGEPVSMNIIRVVPQLYTGDLKKLPASNPLDEQTSLRHSGDFAARPQDYEFEWRHAAPVDGVAPPVYQFQMGELLGGPSTNLWRMAQNPTAPLPPPSAYSSDLYELPRSLAVNPSGYSAASKLPGTVLQAQNSVRFDGLVPTKLIFSANLGTYDGFTLYVNGSPALASRLPQGTPAPSDLNQSNARSDLSPTGLMFQYLVPSGFFTSGDNRIEVALYSSSDPGVHSRIDLRLEASFEVDMADPAVNASSPWSKPNGDLFNSVVVGGSAASPLGSPLLLFSDNYFTLRYRPRGGIAEGQWSRWMEPKLVESWIKRALDGINPYNQRTNDLFNNAVNTDASQLTQAGTRWEGDVALSIDNINDHGLIEIYETLLNRAKSMSIDAGYDDPGTNDTLLLSAGYLADLYMVLANEASDDADNPTIAIDGSPESSAVDTSRFSFEGQVSTLLDEETALLAGRDDFLSPAVTTAPAYNRLYWNFINGVNSGEVIYSLNYNIKEKSGTATTNGSIDAADAQRMFPQGHGDAYGHYLTALKGYYKLLTSPYFTWVPRSEGVDVLGQTVQVDYQDERKFASAAEGVARTAARVLDITARKTHHDDPSAGWSHMRDGKYNKRTDVTRTMGSDEWAARGGLGAYLNWVSANAMLKDVETDASREGIQRIDRTTVPEVNGIVAAAIDIQTALDNQCARLNPLGLANGAVAFDISPTELKAGRSHFEQIRDRAQQAALNARAAFDQASSMNRLLRAGGNRLDQYNEAVAAQERSYEYELINLFGSPYPGDIGAGRIYAQGYTGPDLYRYWMIDRPATTTAVDTSVKVVFREPRELGPFSGWSLNQPYQRITDPARYTERELNIVPHQMMQFAPAGQGKRREPGAVQTALLDVYRAQVGVREASERLGGLMRFFERDYQLYNEFIDSYQAALASDQKLLDEARSHMRAAEAYKNAASLLDAASEYGEKIATAVAEAYPQIVGFSMDTTSVMRSITRYGGVAAGYAQKLASLALEARISSLEGKAQELTDETNGFQYELERNYEEKQHVVEFERLYQQVLDTGFELSRRMADLQGANEQVARLMARGDRILADREIFRQRAAAVVQGYRTRDMAYRVFRNEELSQYQILLQLAGQYSYLAAQSYDYETGLLDSSQGRQWIDGIIATRSLGKFSNGRPVAITSQSGDGGLANILARLDADWSVVKPRLGINNPDQNGTLFSLRQELFRVRGGSGASTEDNKAWRQVLEQHIMSSLLNDPDAAIYCSNLAKPDGSRVPGFLIPFSTTISHGLNFFGMPLAAGDHAFSPSNFATKIHASGVVLEGYIGMDPYAIGTPNAGSPASDSPEALSATPYLYLIPAGRDKMLAPPLGGGGLERMWDVRDQAMPLPFNLGASAFSSGQFFTASGTLNGEWWIPRRHPAFRPVSDQAFFYSTMPTEFTNSRLVGRSVWNTEWKIVIPAYTLLQNEQTALDRFVRSVSDIKLFLRTYSHSGN
jgi:hypothetical protein